MKMKNCNAESFIQGLNGRKVICFGAGSTLMEEEYCGASISDLEKNIAFFLDNDKKKHGLKYKYHGLQFDIKGVDALNTIDVTHYVILITCIFYVEIYEQLNAIEGLKDIECYLFNCVCHCPNIDVHNFFTLEIEKKNFREYKTVLRDLRLKDKHKGERCFIIGNGPSLTTADLELLKDEITFSANRIFKIFPQTIWRPTYYCCVDYGCYGTDYEEINKMNVELRFIPTERAFAAGKVYEEVTYYNRVVNHAKVENGEVVRTSEYSFSLNVEEAVFGGYAVLYDALQFAVYMGFKEIYLLGMDHTFTREVLADGRVIETGVKDDHFSKEYEKGIERIKGYAVEVCAIESGFRKAREICEAQGITIKNATRGGKLEIFDRVDLESIL